MRRPRVIQSPCARVVRSPPGARVVCVWCAPHPHTTGETFGGVAVTQRKKGAAGAYGPLGYMGGSFGVTTTLRQVDNLGAGWAQSGEAFQQYERSTLLSYARHFARNNSVCLGIIKRAANYVVGTGFSVQARTPDPAWNKQAEALWKGWAKSPDISGARTLLDLQIALCRELLQTGECWVLKTNTGRVQVLEAEQIAGGTLADNGIVRDAAGFITDIKVRTWNDKGQANPPIVVPVKSVAFSIDTDRPSCERGVPPLQSIFPMLHRLNDILDSEALSWQMLARMAVAITSDAEQNPDSRIDGDIGDDWNPLDQIVEGDYATIFRGRPGDEIKAIDRNLPGKDFPQSVRMMLRLCGVPLGMPLEFILLDWTGGNYTQGRAVMEQAYAQFQTWQAHLKKVMSSIYLWKIENWMRLGMLPRVDYWAAHEQFTPSWPWLDQLKEIQAATESVESGLATHSEVLARVNKDREEFIQRQKLETIEAIKVAQEVEAATGVKVDWKAFAGRMAGKTENAVNAAAPTTEPAADAPTREGEQD